MRVANRNENISRRMFPFTQDSCIRGAALGFRFFRVETRVGRGIPHPRRLKYDVHVFGSMG